MHIEIEAKIKVDSLAKIVRRLKAVGAKLLGKCLQTDTYLDDDKSSLQKSDSALRLRRQLIGHREKAILTFKGRRRKGRFKQRKEVQFDVADADSAEMLCAVLGFKKSLVFQKKRQVWCLGGCEVALDELPILGGFVEIEGPSERRIAAVQKKLGLTDLPHIPESYAILMERRLGRVRKTGRKVFF
jgi:predicted adenylyl cyclase CyaB